MKFFIIIASILSVTAAQSIRCSYLFNIVYMCQLTISNSNGYNNFTTITGTHQSGFGDADVELVQVVSGSTTIVPRIICTKFPNIGHLSFSSSGLTSIGDTAFSGCLNVVDISLQMNSISSVSANALVNNRELEVFSLSYNNLATLPANLFANQQKLNDLYLGNNPFQNIPAGLFQPLASVVSINLDGSRITAINNQWFAQNSNLRYLSLTSNTIVVNPSSFVGLSTLNGLYLNRNGITDVPSGTFAPLVNLEYLTLSQNGLTQIRANSLPINVVELDLSGNALGSIPDGTFQDLTNLSELDLTFTSLTSLNANSFQGLINLAHITLNTNQIVDLPLGVFASSPLLESVYILNNRLTTVHRRSFGSVGNLYALAFEGNAVRAIDRALIDDAVGLNYLYMNGNVCASFFFHTFNANRVQYLQMLATCFNNAL